MLYATSAVLILLWLLGMAYTTPISGLIDLVLVIALVVLCVSVITGRKPECPLPMSKEDPHAL